jgi:DNA-binding NarL/FixJ family response regulator
MSTRRPNDMKTPSREGGRRNGGDIRIVIGDAHAIDRGGLVWLIEHEQGLCVVGEAASADEALEQCRTLSPDVLVITMNVPDQRDEAVIPMLLRKLPDLRIVALSDRGVVSCVVLNPPSRRRGPAKPAPHCTIGTDCLALAAAQGARATVRRDADPEDLFRAIRAAAAGESWYDTQTTANFATNGSGSPAGGQFERGLSERELDVAALLAEGLSNKEISTALAISEPTVKKHVGHILDKLGLQDRLQAGLHIARNPLIVARRNGSTPSA